MTVPKFKNIKIQAYQPGRSAINKRKKYIKLSANESSLGVSTSVRKIFKNKKLFINRYPDSKSKVLRRAISKKLNCDFDKIICGAGSDEMMPNLPEYRATKSRRFRSKPERPSG